MKKSVGMERTRGGEKWKKKTGKGTLPRQPFRKSKHIYFEHKGRSGVSEREDEKTRPSFRVKKGTLPASDPCGHGNQHRSGVEKNFDNWGR